MIFIILGVIKRIRKRYVRFWEKDIGVIHRHLAGYDKYPGLTASAEVPVFLLSQLKKYIFANSVHGVILDLENTY